MFHSAARSLVAAVVAATVALEVAAVGLAVGVMPLGQPVLYAVDAVVQVAAGAIIVWHHPRHPVGWLLAALAATQAPFDVALSYGRHGYVKGWPGALAWDASWVGPAFGAGTALIGTSLVASAVALLVRFRRSRGVERQQLKWVLLAAALLAVVLPTSAALWSVWTPIHNAPALALALLPIAVCVAIVRHQLYDIDLVISGTVGYGALTGVLGAVYAGVVLAVGAFVASPVAAAAAALVVAVAFWPLRARIQGRVDRRFRRVLGFRSEGTIYDVNGRPRELTPTPGRRTTSLDTGHHVITLAHHRETDAGLVADVLDAGRLALEIAGLQVELRRRLEELDRSRARIVALADEERRRLARDLHDGAQQRLVSIGLNLRHAQHTLNGSGPSEVDRTLDAAVAELGNAIDELRELASGLRPASLDQGLGPALRELAARSPIPVVVRDAPERFTAELEAAAYSIASEGLTNAVKHASAQQVFLAFAREQGQLVLTVADDGSGGANARRGSGLLGLIDRARAHSGSLTVDSVSGAGTRRTARLPCG